MEEGTAVELYIETGDRNEVKRLFDKLSAVREQIEASFGGTLNWQRLEAKRASRVRYVLQLGGLTSGEDNWPVIQDAMIEAMERLVRAFNPHLKSL